MLRADIIYGEHDSIKHSIKSLVINLTAARGRGWLLPLHRVPFIPGIVDYRQDTNETRPPLGRTRSHDPLPRDPINANEYDTFSTENNRDRALANDVSAYWRDASHTKWIFWKFHRVKTADHGERLNFNITLHRFFKNYLIYETLWLKMIHLS